MKEKGVQLPLFFPGMAWGNFPPPLGLCNPGGGFEGMCTLGNYFTLPVCMLGRQWALDERPCSSSAQSDLGLTEQESSKCSPGVGQAEGFVWGGEARVGILRGNLSESKGVGWCSNRRGHRS